MPLTARLGLLSLLLLLAWATDLPAQATDRPTPFKPQRPQTERDLNRVEAMKLYALALVQERDNRLLEAVRTLEQAVRLDGESATLHKTLIPLYLGLDRTDQALASCRQALDLDPGDYQTWYLYARQLRLQDRPKEATEALVRAVNCHGLKEHPGLRLQLYYELAALFENNKEYARAATAFREVCRMLDHPEALLDDGPFSREQIDKQAVETYERLGRVHVQAGSFDEARAAFVKAQEKIRTKDNDPTSIRARRLNRNLADIYLAQNQLPEALACLDDYLTTQPQGTEAYEQKITILDKLGRRQEAVPALEQYAERDRHNAALKLLLAKEYGRAGRAEQAEDLFLKLAAESSNADGYRGLFAFYRDEEKAGRGGAAKVLRLLDEAVAVAAPRDDKDVPPRNPADDARAGSAAAKARAMLTVLQGDAELVKAILPVARQSMQQRGALQYQTRYFLAVLASRSRQLDAAEQFYRDCLENLPPGRRRNSNEWEIYAGLLRVLSMARKHQAIIEVCQRGLTTSENTYRSLFHGEMARSWMALGKMEEAVAQANEAADVAPVDYRLRYRCLRADVLAYAGRKDEAVAECQALFKDYTQPGDVRTIRSTLSAVYQIAHDYPKAEEQLQQILRDDPNDATANNDLGYILADQNKNLAEAERLIRKAIELDRKEKNKKLTDDGDEDNAAFVDSLGWVHFRRGRLPEARKELERAAALPSGADDPVVWDHLGDVVFKLGDAALARAHWRKAVELYETARTRPQDDRYQEIKQKLKLLELEKQP